MYLLPSVGTQERTANPPITWSTSRLGAGKFPCDASPAIKKTGNSRILDSLSDYSAGHRTGTSCQRTSTDRESDSRRSQKRYATVRAESHRVQDARAILAGTSRSSRTLLLPGARCCVGDRIRGRSTNTCDSYLLHSIISIDAQSTGVQCCCRSDSTVRGSYFRKPSMLTLLSPQTLGRGLPDTRII